MAVLELVDVGCETSVATFFALGRDYLAQVMPDRDADDHEMFLRSMLDRQRESHRWLHLFRGDSSHIGLAHTKIDRDDRPGWGYILEFYIARPWRRQGLGSSMCRELLELLRGRGARDVWLASHPPAEQFWQSLGFRFDGTMEGDQRIMVASIG